MSTLQLPFQGIELLDELSISEVVRLPARGESGTPVLDLVVPVYNEQRVLAASVARLHRHLNESMPVGFRITVVDNGSTDETWTVLQDLHQRFDRVAGIRLTEKGRGRALRRAWADSDAAVLAYTDVDLSTGLDALLPLVAPLWSGHSDIAIGSRLARGSRVVRGRKRDVISRCYNALLHACVRAHFTDAQCGFKAITAEAAQRLLPLVHDEEWFFDTELLVLAQRSGLRIYEVPVDWVDDPDSRVDVLDTARKDLKGIWRLMRPARSSLTSRQF